MIFLIPLTPTKTASADLSGEKELRDAQRLFFLCMKNQLHNMSRYGIIYLKSKTI